jgi:hypothetical protein
MFPAAFSKFGQTDINHLSASEWNGWKIQSINFVLIRRRALLDSITELCGEGIRIDAKTAVGESEEDFRAWLEAQIVRPKNFPLQGDA